MKFKIDYNSIKFKSFLYFFLFAGIMMLALWVLQVILLNHFYSTMKTDQTKDVAKQINAYYKNNNTHDFLEKVGEISDSYDMYIYVVSQDGQTTYYSPTPSDLAQAPGFEPDGGEQNQFTQMQYLSQIQTLNEHMIRGNGSAYVNIRSNDSSQEILAYGKYLSGDNKEPLIVYIFSPLWPVSSTINILKNQLIYVTILSLILACGISFYLSVRITRPIRKINNAAKSLAQGNYGVVFKGGHYTELVNLADTLTGASIELEKSDMLQKDLIANVSHDLRTPLTMIKSYAEMIRDISGDNPSKRSEHLKVIVDEADRLNVLVDDLLKISRLQSGKMTLEKTDFSLSDAAENVLNTYHIMEEEDSYKFNFICPSDFSVHADEDKIKQVISNLLNNAIKFCGDNKVIDLSLKKHGRTVRLSVTDRGPGIEADELDHIWERYYRSSRNMIRETQGTGLGLSICKEILTQHKSDFGIDSTVGKGSSFWFELDCTKVSKLKAEGNKTEDNKWTKKE